MIPWYNTPARIAALEAAATSWLGTPFRENSAVRGPAGGVSCHNLSPMLHFETGALEPFALPRHSLRQLLNGPPDMITAWVDEHLADRVIKLETPCEFIPGDFLVMTWQTHVEKHIGTALADGFFVHVMFNAGVVKSRLNDPGFTIHSIRRLIHG